MQVLTRDTDTSEPMMEIKAVNIPNMFRKVADKLDTLSGNQLDEFNEQVVETSIKVKSLAMMLGMDL